MKKPKVWVIGLGRTGTTSICKALEILGYKNVIHNPTFEQLKNGTVDAASDNGCTIFYKYLDYKYTNSKFILLKRDLKSWLKSIRYITEKNPVTNKNQDLQIQRRMLIYSTVGFDIKKYTLAYKRHEKDVKRYFKNRPHDLLEMNIIKGDGWKKLCSFLKKPMPNKDFPHLNKKDYEKK